MKTIKELIGNSTHGNCCSCTECHNYHDECNCEKIETLKEVLELIDGLEKQDWSTREEDMGLVRAVFWDLKQKIEG